jgi:hypothetical protein
MNIDKFTGTDASIDEMTEYAIRNNDTALDACIKLYHRGAISWQGAMQTYAVFSSKRIKELEAEFLRIT